jgi:hypothetical protein
MRLVVEKVIVEPDSASAWIGIIGVLAGVQVTAGLDWLRGWRTGRKKRRQEIHGVVDQLIAGG